jgi:enoyl-CoA hydratase/carnithine racemase
MSLVSIRLDGPVRTVTLERPEKRNAINPQMMAEVAAAFSATPTDAERVSVIRGAGSAFCAGLQLSTDGVDHEEAARIEAMFDAVQRYPLPVVAVVQGPAIAGGCELALHSDFIVAADEAPFAMPLAQLGVATTWFLSKKIMEAAGPVLAREFLLLGDPLRADRLSQLGVVTRSVPAAELEEAAASLIGRLAANAPLAMRAMKAQIIRHMDFMLHTEHADLEAMAVSVYSTADAVEGVAARVLKRQPQFLGR